MAETISPTPLRVQVSALQMMAGAVASIAFGTLIILVLSSVFGNHPIIVWTAVAILRGRGRDEVGAGSRLATISMLLVVVVFVTMISGAFVAGLKAGMIYNTFPLMGDAWLPDGMWSMSPAWLNFFENAATVQFNHRVIALATFAGVVALWLGARSMPLTRAQGIWLHIVLAAAVVQVSLGVSTLLLRVPVTLAALHQAGAMVLLTVLLCLAYESRYRAGPSVQST